MSPSWLQKAYAFGSMVLTRATTVLRHLLDTVLGEDSSLPRTEDSPETIGQRLIDMLQKGEYIELRALLARRIRWLVSAKKLEQSWKSILSSQGEIVSVDVGEVTKSGDMTVVRFPLVFERGAVAVVVRISKTGHLTSIRAIPDYSSAPWSPPSYIDEKLFDEVEVTLGEEDRAVPASLTIPSQSTANAAVILLQGSGPCDRNESIGQLKPFKDLAWGFSSQGSIAVLRFDKFTFVHPGKPISNPTVDDEYTYYVLAAISLLGSRGDTKDLPIFLLGHSLGGTVLPRIAKAGPQNIAGLVIMAGLTRPLHWTAIRQLQYMNTLKNKKYHVSKAIINAATKQAKFVDSPSLTISTASSKLPFDTPASFWLDLRNYDAVATAKGLDVPMLVLQGGRDYQITIEDDFVAWEVGLKDKGDQVGFKVYPDKNHVFMAGSGMSSPEEYEVQGGHVDADVVDDIVGWIKRQIGDSVELLTDAAEDTRDPKGEDAAKEGWTAK